MLERQALWLGPWTSPDDDASSDASGRQRVVRDPSSDEALGTAWHFSVASRWLPGLCSTSVEVREAGDESLLFSLVRRWAIGETWLVREADQRRVGRLCGTLIRDSLGRRLAM